MTEFQSFGTLIKRLEAATSRLEDLATSSASAVAVNTNLSRSSLDSQPATPSAASQSNNDAAVEDVPFLRAYDALIEEPLKNFVEISKRIGGLVEDQSRAVKDTFAVQRNFIYIATQSKKPVISSEITELLKPTSQAIEKVCEYRENNRRSPFFNHLSTVSEGIGALGWVAVEPKPAPYVGDLKDSSEFYAHRVIKEFKDKETTHVEWANSFISLLTELRDYVKKYHTTGLVWNPQGQDAKTFAKSTDSVPAPPDGPPVPPPPPPTDFASTGQVNMSSVFAELNRGEAVTANLKKVDKSQMTHKNPSLRASVTDVSVTDVSAQKKGPTAPPKPASLSLKKPPRTELEGTKWFIENHENNLEVIIEQTATNHAVYIFGCKNSTIQVKGKVNAVTFDSCQNTGLLIESTVSAVYVVNCKSFRLQILGRTPTISVDKTDIGQIFLSPECLDIEILTAKSSSINVNVPGLGEDGDYAEKPVPEQLKSTIVDGKLVTVPVEHVG